MHALYRRCGQIACAYSLLLAWRAAGGVLRPRWCGLCTHSLIGLSACVLWVGVLHSSCHGLWAGMATALLMIELILVEGELASAGATMCMQESSFMRAGCCCREKFLCFAVRGPPPTGGGVTVSKSTRAVTA